MHCARFDGGERMELLLATRNPHKVREIAAILHPTGLRIVAADAFPDLPEVVEDGATFEANASKKAAMLARAAGLWTLADDSGLEVDALGGAPGVYSARYAGEPVDYEANNRKVLRQMAGVRDRAARFRCVIALSDPAGNVRTVEGRCEGRIIRAPRGRQGFGYDPIFVPDGFAETFAEMDGETKNRISHRAAALRLASEAWAGILRNGE
jgi:XTP/dITP diphosphohydrolase